MLKTSCLACGRIIPTGNHGKCLSCRNEMEARRGTTTARGYGSDWARTSKRIIARDGGICRLLHTASHHD